MSDATDLFREWRTADKAAHALEKQLLNEAIASIDGGGAAPHPDSQEKAKRLRQVANDLFTVAMAEMTEQARLLRASRK